MQTNVHESTIESSTSVEPAVARDLHVAGALFFVLAAQFMVGIMLAAALVPGYDFNTAAISDLGVFSQTALLFNGSLVFVGLATLAGGYMFFRWHGAVWLLVLFVLAGLGAILAGIVTLESAPGLHGIGALVAFLFFNLLGIGTATRLVGPMRMLSALLGLVGLAFVVSMAIGDGGNTAVFGPIGHGGIERMIVYPPMLWLLAVGGYLMGTRTDSATAGPPSVVAISLQGGVPRSRPWPDTSRWRPDPGCDRRPKSPRREPRNRRVYAWFPFRMPPDLAPLPAGDE